MNKEKILKIIYKQYGRTRAIKVYANSLDKTDNFLLKAKIFSLNPRMDGDHIEIPKKSVEQIRGWSGVDNRGDKK